MGSRLHKVGSIYSRITSILLKKGESEFKKPLWYDIYSNFPPDREPTYMRKLEDVEEKVKEIFYPEDLERAKIQNALVKFLDPIDLTESKTESQTQSCIKLYNNYIKNGYSEEDALNKIVVEIKNKSMQSNRNISSTLLN